MSATNRHLSHLQLATLSSPSYASHRPSTSVAAYTLEYKHSEFSYLAMVESQNTVAAYERSGATKRRRLNRCADCAAMYPDSEDATSFDSHSPTYAPAALKGQSSPHAIFPSDDGTVPYVLTNHTSLLNANGFALTSNPSYTTSSTRASITPPSFRQLLESCNLVQQWPELPTSQGLFPHPHSATGYLGQLTIPSSVRSTVRSLPVVNQVSAEEEQLEVSRRYGYLLMVSAERGVCDPMAFGITTETNHSRYC